MMNRDTVFWDQLGQPVFFLKNDWIIDLKGTQIGFVDKMGAVYNLKGYHVAWYQGGIMRDYYGACLAFCEPVEDLMHPPLPPARMQAPLLPNKLYPMVHPPATVASPPPLPRYSWSTQNAKDIFR